MTTGQPPTHYEVLGVAENASLDEIKRAYYTQVRKNPAERNPDLFHQLTEAGAILTDYRRRGEYDQQRRSGKRVQILLDQAAAALEKDNQHAIALLKSAIALAPDMLRPRHLLAHVLMKVEEYGLAEKQYRWLLKELPRDEALHYKMGRCLHLQDRLSDAERELITALRLNPRYHDALMLISRVYEDGNQYDLARDALEKAIANDDQENYADTDALLRMIILSLLADHEANIEPLAERLISVVPKGDGESNQEKATRAVKKILARARELFNERRYTIAVGILNLVERIENAEEEVRAEASALSRLTVLTAETRHMETDQLLPQPIKDLFHWRYLDKTSAEQRQKRFEAINNALSAEIARDPRGVGKNLEYLRREYPQVSEDHAAVLQALASRVAKRLEMMGAASMAVMPGASAPAPESSSDSPRKKGLFGIFRGKK